SRAFVRGRKDQISTTTWWPAWSLRDAAAANTAIAKRSARVRRQASGDVPAGHRARGDIEPVPPVDRDDRQAQVCEFVFGEFLPDPVVHLVRDVTLSDQRECFSPVERGTLSRR